jgi:crotonobetainyl-CoA:carnitine CoA-transferase CaiB-like acyl-CoA transferase
MSIQGQLSGILWSTADALSAAHPAACCCTQTPVWRQLYTEKQVVAEERRMRTDNAPMGKFQARHSIKAPSCSATEYAILPTHGDHHSSVCS